MCPRPGHVLGDSFVCVMGILGVSWVVIFQKTVEFHVYFDCSILQIARAFSKKIFLFSNFVFHFFPHPCFCVLGEFLCVLGDTPFWEVPPTIFFFAEKWNPNSNSLSSLHTYPRTVKLCVCLQNIFEPIPFFYVFPPSSLCISNVSASWAHPGRYFFVRSGQPGQICILGVSWVVIFEKTVKFHVYF